jgi:hypothetical protein
MSSDSGPGPDGPPIEEILARIAAEARKFAAHLRVLEFLHPVAKPEKFRSECQSPGVVSGTFCLVNTSGRCTWCGRWMGRLKPPEHSSSDPVRNETGEFDEC